MILDRVTTDYDDLWRTLDFTIVEPSRNAEPSSTVAPLSAADGSVVVKSEVSANSCGTAWTNDGYDVDSGIFGGTSGSTSVSRNSVSGNRIDSASSAISYNFEVKKEQIDIKEEDGVAPLVDVAQQPQEVTTVRTDEDKDEMVEFLRSLRRDW